MDDEIGTLVRTKRSCKQDCQGLELGPLLRRVKAPVVDPIIDGRSFDTEFVAKKAAHVPGISSDGLRFSDVACQGGSRIAFIEFSSRDDVRHERRSESEPVSKVKERGVEGAFARK